MLNKCPPKDGEIDVEVAKEVERLQEEKKKGRSHPVRD